MKGLSLFSEKKKKKDYKSLWNMLYEEGKGGEDRHDTILDFVYNIMEESCDYKVLKKKMPYPTNEMKGILKEKNDVGEIDILGLHRGTGNLVDVEIKSNGMTLPGAVEQLSRANEWIYKNRNLVEKLILHNDNSFEGIENMVCYMFSGRLIFHDVDIKQTYQEGIDPELEWDEYKKKNDWKKDYESFNMGSYEAFDVPVENERILKVLKMTEKK